MKISDLTKGAAAVLAAGAIILTSCGKEKKEVADSGDGGKPPAGDTPTDPPVKEDPPTKPETKDPDPTPPAPPTPPTPPAGGGGGKVAKAMNGYWAINKESFLEMAQKEAPPETGEAEIAAMMPLLEQMFGMMVVELRDGKATIHNPDGEEKESYKIVSTDDATGAFVVDMIDGDGNSEKGEGTVKGDTMTMTADGITMKMDRLSDAEFAKRKEAMANFKPNLEGLIPPGVIPEGAIPPGALEGSIPVPPPTPKPPKPPATPPAPPAPPTPVPGN